MGFNLTFVLPCQIQSAPGLALVITKKLLIRATVKAYDNKQILDEVCAISAIIKVEVTVISQSRRLSDNTYRDLDYSGYRKNLIQ